MDTAPDVEVVPVEVAPTPPKVSVPLHLDNFLIPFDGRDAIIGIIQATPGSVDDKLEAAADYVWHACPAKLSCERAGDLVRDTTIDYLGDLINRLCDAEKVA